MLYRLSGIVMCFVLGVGSGVYIYLPPLQEQHRRRQQQQQHRLGPQEEAGQEEP